MYFARTHQKGVGCRLWRRPRLKVWKFFLMQKKFALEVGLGREELQGIDWDIPDENDFMNFETLAK